jgi:hypothetical protein
MDIFSVYGDVSQSTYDPSVKRPVELVPCLYTSYKNWDVGCQEWDIEYADMVGHEDICFALMYFFGAFRFNANEKNFKQEFEHPFDPGIVCMRWKKEGNEKDEDTGQSEIDESDSPQIYGNEVFHFQNTSMA